MRGRGGSSLMILGLATLAVGCSTDPAGPSPIDRVVVESGDLQTGAPGDVLAQPVTARVYREDGSAAIYALWVHMEGEGAIDLGGARGSGVGALLQAPELGVASVTWTLGSQTGPQTLRFFAVRGPGDTVSVRATAQAVSPR